LREELVLGFKIGNRVLFLQSRRNGDEGDMKMKRGNNKGGTKKCLLQSCYSPSNLVPASVESLIAAEMARKMVRSTQLTMG